MRFPRIALIAGFTVAAAAACSDATAPTALQRTASPPPVAAANANEKITVCHAAGQAGTTHYIAITVSVNASYAHIDEHGTPAAGHEQDFIATAQHQCSTPNIDFTKTLFGVFTEGPGGTMIPDPNFTGGSIITIPVGETRWIQYTLAYSLPAGVTATISDIESEVCGALAGSGFGCTFSAFNPGTVSGTGSVSLIIDIVNNGACGDKPFTNYATLTPSVGAPVTAAYTVTLRGLCITFNKALTGVFTEGAGGTMVPDASYTGGNVVLVPLGQTRWLQYTISYSLPAGVTATITENESLVCGALTGTGFSCSFGSAFNPGTVSGTGSVNLIIDITNNNKCGDVPFTNTATLTPSVGAPITASSTITLRWVCVT